MQNRSNTRSMLVAQSASRTSSQVMQGIRSDSRSRPSNTLRRAGSVLSAELGDRLSTSPATTPPTGVTASLAALSSSSTQPLGAVGEGTDNMELPNTPPEDGSGSMSGTCGLTPASLKHLRRQNQKLTDEKESLRKELENAQVQIRELKERIAALEEQLRESEERQEKLQQELVEAREGEASQRKRAEDADRLNIRLEESLAGKEAEVARLRQALEEQLQLTKEVCEAAERSSGEARGLAESADEVARLNEKVKQLEREKDIIQKESRDQELKCAAMQQQTVAAMAAAEKAMSMHAHHLQRMEQLRVAKLADAIQHKVELHISVPRVTLSYNNAPPLLVSIASGLGDRIRDFLDTEVFPHFEPLWVTLDAMDKAPDGTSKKAYSSRMLERLTEAVKGFVEKSQKSDSESGLTPSVREPLYASDGTKSDCSHDRSDESQQRSSVRGPTNNSEGRRTSQAECDKAKGHSVGEAVVSRQSLGDTSPKKHTGSDVVNSESRTMRTGQGSVPACAMDSLAEADRDRLLTLLRSGDDRGLDSKLKELLESRS